MRQNILWIILLVNLVAMGTGLGYVAARPAETRVMAGLLPRLAGSANVAASAGVTAKNSSKSSSSTPRSASTSTATESVEVAAPASTGEAETSPGVRRPPARRAPPPKAQNAAADEKIPRVEAVYVGPYHEPISVDAPAVALYPFKVVRRTYPEDSHNQTEIEILMKNASGYHWKNAFIILKSADPTVPPHVWQVEEWRINGHALLKYRFPREDLRKRVSNLRVIAIYGERRESSLSNQMGDARANYAESGNSINADTRTAENLREMWNKTAEAIRSGEIQTATGEAPIIEVSIEKLPLIPDEYDPGSPTTDEQKEAFDLARNTHQAALNTQKELLHLVQAINTDGYLSVRQGEGTAIMQSVQAARTKYDDLGIDFVHMTNTSKDEQVKGLEKQFWATNQLLLGLIETIQRQVKSVDPNFTIEG